MKKRIGAAVFGLLLSVVSVSADQDTWSKPGRLTAQAGIGSAWRSLGQVQGGIDYSLAQVAFAPTFPVDFGFSGRVALATAGVGLGAYGTAHYTWKSLRTGQDWIDRFEIYLGLGLGVLPAIRLDGYGGLAYHLDKGWAVYVEGATFGGVIGASYRLQ